MATKILGIDVSKHNGDIDWTKVKNDGVEFVIIRAGYGSSTVDNKFIDNIKGAISAGLYIGIYWFSYAINTEKAKIEAKKCLDTISPYKNNITYPVFYDFEYDSVNYATKNGVTVTKTLASNIVKAFLEEINAAGYIPGVYTNIDYSKNYFTSELLNSYDTWIAHYSSRLGYSGEYTIWQYSESGKVSGINGNVDMNYSYNDYGNKTLDTTKVTYIKSLQTALNNSYNVGLNVDGLYGPLIKEVIKAHYLKKGSSNSHVKWLQSALNKVMSAGLSEDGSFGDKTLQVVKNFQKKYSLTVDGYAGEETHTKIINLL